MSPSSNTTATSGLISSLRRLCHHILAPVSGNPVFFIAVTLMSAAIPWMFAITQGAKILWLMLFATVQGTALSYLLCLLVSLMRNRVVRLVAKTMILVILGLLTLAEAGAITMTGQPLTSDSVNLLLETNSRETSGFFSQYLSAKAVVTMIAFCIAIIAASLISPLIISKLKQNRGGQNLLRWIAIIILSVTVFAGAVRIITLLRPLGFNDYRQLLEWAAQDPGNPVLVRVNQLKFSDPLSKWSYICKELSLQRRNLSTWEQTQQKLLTMPVNTDNARDFNIIIIIGESFIRAHSSLYGYYLPTSPRLAEERSRGNLAVFTDMLSPANFTTTSMRNFLNLNDLSSGEDWAEGAYFPLVVKMAGWKVFHFDNQTISRTTDAGISQMLYSPINLSHTYDGVADSVFDYDGDFTAHIEQTLRPHEIPGKKMVTYHLWGQHFAAADRFPGTPRFTVADITIDKPWLDEDKRQEIADYDSATYYNDSVVGAIIDYWRDTPAIVIYFSDHGEDCWDLAPVEARNRPMPEDKEWLDRQYRVPFFIWMSDDFRRDYPEIEQRIILSTDRPGMLDNLGQAVIGLAGISAPCYREERDITSPAYIPRPRVTAEGYRFD